MKPLFSLATLALFFTSCMIVDVGNETGNGIVATEIRSLRSFDQIRLDAPVHVILKSGPAYEAYITADANLTECFQTDAFAGTLTISMTPGIQPSIEPVITIIVPDEINLTHNGNGLVEIEEDGSYPDVNLTLNGDGEIFFSGTASTIHTTLNGSGEITLEGYASLLVADLYGNGTIQGQNLLVGDADAAVSGSGSLFLDLDYHSVFNLTLSGSGLVEWWGAPARLNYTLLGSGRVVEHRGLPKKSAAAKTGVVPLAKSSTKALNKSASGEVSGPYETVPVLPKKTRNLVK